MTFKLLIVDDELPNIRLLERLFRDDYFVLTASSGDEAVTVLGQHDVAVVITDQRMPGMSGVELLKRSAERRPHMVRILLTGYTDLDALVEAVNCGLVYMYVSKPWKNEDLKLRIARAVQHYEDNKRQHSLGAANVRLTNRLREMKLGVVRAIAGVIKVRDVYTYAHGSRVSRLATLLGERCALDEEVLTDLTAAAFMCDVGALPTRDEILEESKAFLDGENFCLSECGAQILSSVPELRDVADMIRDHCENFDGSGYPVGLIGEQIPLASRIIRVAAEYDRLINPRYSSKALNHAAALHELRKVANKTLDPHVVEMFSRLGDDEVRNLQQLNAHTRRPDLITRAIN